MTQQESGPGECLFASLNPVQRLVQTPQAPELWPRVATEDPRRPDRGST